VIYLQTNSALTKLCSSCGLQKPLSAFLEFSSSEGTFYSNICSTCRKTNIEEGQNKETTDIVTTTSGGKIDAKAKMHSDIAKKQEHQNVGELYQEEREKTDEKLYQQIIKTNKIATDEKKHRRDFLGKSSFLSETRRDKQGAVDPASPEFKEELEKQINFTVPFQDTQIVKQKHGAEYQKVKAGLGGLGAEFDRMKRWLNSGSPIIQQAELALRNKQQKENQDKNKKTDENIEKPSGSQPSRRK